MFGFWGSKSSDSGRETDWPVSRCTVFYREPLTGPGVYVEVRDIGDHLVYVSNRGVTPSFLNKPYDDWCRESLLESYVFASIDSALDYFQRRQSGIIPDVAHSLRDRVMMM